MEFKELKERFENKTNIIRVQKNKENPYVMINKACINDNELSWGAKGLHTYLLSLPDNWTIHISELVNHTSSGRDHTYTLVKELLKLGYMEKIQYRFKGKVLGLSYTVFETPIDISNVDNTKGRIVNLTKNSNGEIVENTTYKPNTENPYSDNPDTVSTELLNNNINNNNINNNKFDDEDERETKLVNLYKTFKIEKRVMPHTLKLLKENIHISLNVFEQIFISASGEDVKKKYAYLKETIDDLNKNKVITLNDYEKYSTNFKESKKKEFKNVKQNNKTYKKESSEIKTRMHNVNATYKKYDNDKLEKMLLENQRGKFESYSKKRI